MFVLHLDERSTCNRAFVCSEEVCDLVFPQNSVVEQKAVITPTQRTDELIPQTAVRCFKDL